MASVTCLSLLFVNLTKWWVLFYFFSCRFQVATFKLFSSTLLDWIYFVNVQTLNYCFQFVILFRAFMLFSWSYAFGASKICLASGNIVIFDGSLKSVFLHWCPCKGKPSHEYVNTCSPSFSINQFKMLLISFAW